MNSDGQFQVCNWITENSTYYHDKSVKKDTKYDQILTWIRSLKELVPFSAEEKDTLDHTNVGTCCSYLEDQYQKGRTCLGGTGEGLRPREIQCGYENLYGKVCPTMLTIEAVCHQYIFFKKMEQVMGTGHGKDS
jgi:hypothetical protein